MPTPYRPLQINQKAILKIEIQAKKTTFPGGERVPANMMAGTEVIITGREGPIQRHTIASPGSPPLALPPTAEDYRYTVKAITTEKCKAFVMEPVSDSFKVPHNSCSYSRRGPKSSQPFQDTDIVYLIEPFEYLKQGETITLPINTKLYLRSNAISNKALQKTSKLREAFYKFSKETENSFDVQWHGIETVSGLCLN